MIATHRYIGIKAALWINSPNIPKMNAATTGNKAHPIANIFLSLELGALLFLHINRTAVRNAPVKAITTGILKAAEASLAKKVSEALIIKKKIQ